MNIPVRAFLHLTGAVLGLLLTGCATLPQPPQVDFAEPRTPVAAAPSTSAVRPVTGSLFHTARYRPGFEDRRARLVGDAVTIVIKENLAASQTSTSTANRTSKLNAELTALPGFSFPGGSADQARIGAASANDFSGKGGTESANTFSGSITATVAEVLPNGHLLVVGEKQIGVNQNVDVLRFSGTIDPFAVQPGNLINSTQVANVRVESRGRGAQYEAQTVGWLSRFFFSFLPF